MQLSPSHHSPSHWPVVIIGAGAAGLQCARLIAAQHIPALLIDHANRVGNKIRISGGGKCNFTNWDIQATDYVCQNPHFVKSALSRYTQWDFIDWVHQHHIAWETRDNGQLFCLNNASDIVHGLWNDCHRLGVQRQLQTRVTHVQPSDLGFTLQCQHQGHDKRQNGLPKTITCERLVIATGALSYPKLKASDWGYRIAKQFDLSIVPTRPGLVPLGFDHIWQQRFASLAGNSLPITISTADQRQSFDGDCLFTHQGLSGPAILQISNHWQPSQPLIIHWLCQVGTAEQVFTSLKQAKQNQQTLKQWLENHCSKAIAQALMTWFANGIQPLQKLAEIRDDALKHLAQQMSQHVIQPSHTLGYDKAEITLGGVDTQAISSQTLAVKHQPNLYFIGEVLDVSGKLGGYNFQWAWSSGYAAAKDIGTKYRPSD